jgi:glycosyltransferase involved in cell wall biosynthesis
MKKILIISPWADDWDLERIKRSPENAYFFKEILKEFEVYHLFLKDKEICTPLSSNHYLFEVKKVNFKKIPFLFFFEFILNNIKIYLKAKQILKEDINVVLCFSSYLCLSGFLIKRFLKKIVILKLFGIFTYFNSNFIKKIFLIPEKLCFLLPFDFIFCVDDGSGGEKLRKITGFPKEKFKILKNCYPLKWKEIELKEKEKIILGVSALEKCKGFNYFIKAANEVLKKRKDVIFLICGEGSEEKKLKKLIKKYGIEDNFKFVGGIPHPMMPDFYLKAKIFVSTNIYGNKTIPVIEAMLFSIPPIVFEIREEKELIKDGINGYLVPFKDYKKISKKINLLLEDDDLREKMGKRARNFILKNFKSWEERIKEEIDLIKNFYEIF